MRTIARKKGTSFLAGLVAKGALAGLGTVSTYGVGTALTVGLLAKDAYDIHQILTEGE